MSSMCSGSLTGESGADLKTKKGKLDTHATCVVNTCKGKVARVSF